MDVRLKISPPWITYVNEVKALFGNDPSIKVEYNKDCELKLYVESGTKAEAIEMLLPEEIDFGNVTLYITIVPGNDSDISGKPTNAWLFNTAFEGNPVFAFTHTVSGIFGNDLTYVVFKNRVVQFFNDNLNDVYGNISTLYQEIAKDVFRDDLYGVCYCTDIEELVGKPLGEWP